MVEKSGLKITTEMLPLLVNMVVPVGISRTSLSRGVQVILLFCVIRRLILSRPTCGESLEMLIGVVDN